MKFTNIKLASKISGARPGQGLKTKKDYYVTGSEFSFGTDADDTVIDEDYYVVWNNWPEFTGANHTGTSDIVGTAFDGIGITVLKTALKATHTADTSLDCVIIRKSDRKAVRLQITGTTRTHYQNIDKDNTGSTTITAVDPDDGPWTPEVGRLVNMGYIG